MILPPVYHLLFALGVIWGASWIIADSKISRPFRLWLVTKWGTGSWLLQLLECPACTSFWMGWTTGWRVLKMGIFGGLAFGLLACGVSLILAAVTIGINYKE